MALAVVALFESFVTESGMKGKDPSAFHFVNVSNIVV